MCYILGICGKLKDPEVCHILCGTFVTPFSDGQDGACVWICIDPTLEEDHQIARHIEFECSSWQLVINVEYDGLIQARVGGSG